MNNLGNLYEEQRKFGLAKGYYEMAITYRHNNSYAMTNLGNFYRKHCNLDLAEKYFLMAVFTLR